MKFDSRPHQDGDRYVCVGTDVQGKKFRHTASSPTLMCLVNYYRAKMYRFRGKSRTLVRVWDN